MLIKRAPIQFLQAVLILTGMSALLFLLWEPHVEGVNANAATFSDIYFDDPFLAYVYLASIPFFVALYHAFTLLSYVGHPALFSPEAAKAVRTIKYCGVILIGLIVPAIIYLFITQAGKDDIAGGIAMGLFAMFISVVIAASAAVFEKLLQSTAAMKSKPQP